MFRSSLNIALPAKGRLREESLRLFRKKKIKNIF